MLVIDLHFGLSNRIRTLLGYLYVSKKKKEPLFVSWRNTKDCPGVFCDYFENIPNVAFLKVGKNAQFKNLRNMKGVDVFQGQTYIHKIPKKYGYNISQEEIINMYRELKLKPNLQKIINDFSAKHVLEDAIGLHIRRTDHPKVALHWMKKYTTDKEFHEKIKEAVQKNPMQRFFLATDNHITQQNFIRIYKGRIITYQSIKDNKLLRKTSLEHSIIDVYLLSRCQEIFGSHFSSFTTMAERLHKVHVQDSSDSFRVTPEL